MLSLPSVTMPSLDPAKERIVQCPSRPFPPLTTRPSSRWTLDGFFHQEFASWHIAGLVLLKSNQTFGPTVSPSQPRDGLTLPLSLTVSVVGPLWVPAAPC